MGFYVLPENIDQELREFEELVQSYKDGQISAQEFRSRRVPFGVYEQRTPETYMARIRCPGGAIAPAQFKRVAELAREFASGTVHITTRQELQIHDLPLDSLPQVLRELRAVELSTRGGGGNTVRNITASHDSGIHPDEAFDVLPHAVALTNRFISEPDSWTLPRKLKIAFANREPDNVNARFNDIGFVAQVENGRRGFRVFVAGGYGRKPEVAHLLHPFI